MKDGRGLAIAAVIGLGLWAWQKGKVSAEPARKPAAETARKPAAEPLETQVTQPGAGQIVVETNRSPTIPETIELASQIIETYPDVVTVTLPSWTGEGEVHYDAPSIVQAAEMSGMSTEAWIALYGYGVTP